MRSKLGRGLKLVGIVGVIFGGVACAASQWKVQGPAECKAMCTSWGLEFTAMVGVGTQDEAVAQGATACVCEVKRSETSASSEAGESPVMAASIAATHIAIADVAEQEEAVRQAEGGE